MPRSKDVIEPQIGVCSHMQSIFMHPICVPWSNYLRKVAPVVDASFKPYKDLLE